MTPKQKFLSGQPFKVADENVKMYNVFKYKSGVIYSDDVPYALCPPDNAIENGISIIKQVFLKSIQMFIPYDNIEFI